MKARDLIDGVMSASADLEVPAFLKLGAVKIDFVCAFVDGGVAIMPCPAEVVAAEPADLEIPARCDARPDNETIAETLDSARVLVSPNAISAWTEEAVKEAVDWAREMTLALRGEPANVPRKPDFLPE